MPYQATGPLPDDLPPGVSLDRAKARLGTGGSGIDDTIEEVLRGVIGWWISTYQRRLYPSPPTSGDDPVTLPLTLRYRHTLVRLPDAREITTVTLDGSALDDSEWAVLEQNGVGVHLVVKRRPWWPVDSCDDLPVDVTGRFGFETAPPDLVDAFYAHAARNYREKDAAYADQVDYSDQGGGVASYFRTMSNRVKAVYGSYAVPSDSLSLA